MTKTNYAPWMKTFLGMSSMMVLLLACSEQPEQKAQKTKPPVEQATKEMTELQQETETKQETPAQNEQAKAELIAAVTEAKTALKESETLLREAPGGKDSEVALLALERELQSAETLLVDVGEAIDQGDYLKAKGQIQEIKETTSRVNQEIKQAIRKIEGGR